MTSMHITACLSESKSLLKTSLNLAMQSKNFLKIVSVMLLRLRNLVLNWFVMLL